MKQRQYITTFSLIVALTGMSPVMAEDARGTTPQAQVLSLEQMDSVTAGSTNLTPNRVMTTWAYIDWRITVIEANTIHRQAQGCVSPPCM